MLFHKMPKKQTVYTGRQALQKILDSDSDISDVSLSDVEDDDSFIPVHDIASETEDNVSEEVSDSEDDQLQPAEEHTDETETAHGSVRGGKRGSGRGQSRGRGGARGRGRGRGKAKETHVQCQKKDNASEQSQPDVMKGKNGKVWNLNPPATYKRGPQDIIRHHVGITAEGKVQCAKASFELFLTDEIVDIVMRETNREAGRVFRQWNEANADNQKTWTAVTMTEMKAVFGILILAGVNHSAHEALEELWVAKTGRPIFRATMSLNRLKCILRFMRFDNKSTRPQRREQDKLAAFRDVWTMFAAQLPKFYVPSTDITVDEQLVPFRGRCPFRQYMKSKPAKYGIKIWWNSDSLSSYPLSGQVYLGKQPGEEREVNQGARVVKDLVQPWYRTGRNVNADNFFTSVSLAEELLTNHLTYVGTIRKNKQDIPPEMQPSPGREEQSSIFGFAGQVTLVSYVPKKRNAVLLLSTMHHDKAVESDTKKPEIITHYNAHKGGVDNMDHLVGTYSVKRKCNRWPMVLFFNLIDVAALAAYIVWLCNFPNWSIQRRCSRRRLFLQMLGEELVEDLLQERLQKPQVLQRSVKSALVDLGKLDLRQHAAQGTPSAKKRCYLCPREADRKVRQCCMTCGSHVCQDHSVVSIKCDECP